MVISLGPIGSTVLDITAILGTSLFDLPIDTALSGFKFDLDLKTTFEERAVEALMKEDQRSSKEDVLKLHKFFFNYNTLITHFAPSYSTGTKNTFFVPS